jgi:hypothetical protein
MVFFIVSQCSENLKFYFFFPYVTVMGMTWCCGNCFEVMVFCNIMLCSLVDEHQCFQGTWLCHIQFSPHNGAVAFSETSLCFY